jgi:hypothetical protein
MIPLPHAPRQSAFHRVVTSALGILLGLMGFVSVGVCLGAGPERLGPSSRRTAIALSELHFDADSAPASRTGSTEFVALFNGDILPVALDGHRLSGAIQFRFPSGTRLAPGATLLVARDPQKIRALHPSATVIGPYEGSLHSEAFRLELHDEFGALLLEVRVDPQAGFPGLKSRLGQSLVLTRPSCGEGIVRAWSLGGRTIESIGSSDAGSQLSPVVFNELSFHPISGSDHDQFIELFNRTDQSVDLTGWRLSGGVEFTFARGTVIPARGYLVVARDARRLRGRSTFLNRGNCVGNFSGALSHSGERIALERPLNGARAEAGRFEVAEEMTYRAGGRWGVWSDGGGSTLERIDPEADARDADSWRDSDESAKSEWTPVEFTGRVGPGLGIGAGTSLHLYLLGEGECRVDDVELRVNQGTNRVVNGGFESGLQGWRPMGAMDQSGAEPGGFSGGMSLHLRAGSRGDPGANKVVSATFAAVKEGDWITLRCKARWLSGWPELLLRLQGGGAEAAGKLRLPISFGTPGARNSRAVSAAGPAIRHVEHFPVLPPANAPVVVTARVETRRGLDRVMLRYRVDPGVEVHDLAMNDRGESGDAVAGDGVFSATVPAQPAGALVAFHVVAVGGNGATNSYPREVFPRSASGRFFPGDSLSHECLVRFGEPRIEGPLATYRIWMTQANRDRWIARDRLSNADLDVTFVYDDRRVIYGAGAQTAGSPWHTDQMATGPDGTNRFDYVVHLPKDEPVLGETDLNLVIPGNGDGANSSDLSALSEPVSLQVFHDLGLPTLHRRFIHLFVNGSERSAVSGVAGHFVYEDVQQPNGHSLQGWFPGASHAPWFKVEDWFEFTNSAATTFENKDADLLRRVISGTTSLSTAPYRFMWRIRGVHAGESASDYSGLFELIDAMSPTLDPAAEVDVERVMRVADLDQWFRVIACQRALGNWDSYGWDRGKNCYLFRPRGGRFVLVPWDVDATLALGGKEPDSDWFEVSDPRLASALRVPRVRRSYLRSLQEVLDGPYREGRLEALFDERTQALHAAGVTTDSQLTIANKAYLKTRRAHLRTELARHAASFNAVPDPQTGRSISTRTLRGTAPLAVETIRVHGRPLEIRWRSVTEWTAEVPVEPTNGAREATLECIGFDRFGAPVPQARIMLRW